MPPQDFNERLNEFRKSRMGMVTGIVLAFLISLSLLWLTYSTPLGSSSTVCFIFIAVAAVLFAVPYYFGWKDKKRLAVAGIVLLLILGVSFGLIIFNQYMSYEGQKLSSSDGVIQDATVTPFRGIGSTEHHFSALVNSSYDNVTMIIQNVWNGSGLVHVNSTGNGSVAGGTMHYFNITLQDGLYLYQINATAGNALNSTVAGFGPIDLANSALLEQLVVSGLIVVLMQIGILFFLFLLLSTLTSRSRERAKEQAKRKEELEANKPVAPKEKVVCSECGAEVPAEAKECPQCGEKFEEETPRGEKEGDFVCTECGATVKEEDKKCWNCGKEFEN